jgi:hypothetical protein
VRTQITAEKEAVPLPSEALADALYRAVGVNPTFMSPIDIAASKKRVGTETWTTHPASSHW